MGGEKLATGEMSEDELIAKALAAAHNKSQRLEMENSALKLAVERFLQTTGYYCTSLVAPTMGMGSTWQLHGALDEKGVFDRSMGGYFKVVTK